MTYRDNPEDEMRYSLILLLPDSRKILVLEKANGYCFPSARIPRGTRIARELQKAIQKAWMLNVIILDVPAAENGDTLYVVAEVLYSKCHVDLLATEIKQGMILTLSEKLRAQLLAISHGEPFSDSPFSKSGWIDQSIAWLEAETGKRLVSKSQIEQYNAGGGFALVRFRMDDHSDYWLKATGEPNAHELAVTCALSELAEDFLPRVVATKPAWNAWLMSGDTSESKELHTDRLEVLSHAVVSMAQLQLKTVGHRSSLLAAGAFDQSLFEFQRHSKALFDFLEEALQLQASTKTQRLDAERLREMHSIFQQTTRRMEDLDLPQTIVHGDISWGNILESPGRCQFIDWCEAYVGNPFITLQHLLLLNQQSNLEVRASANVLLKDRYKRIWLEKCDANVIDEAYVYMELLAIASTLYGRCDWLTKSGRGDPRRQVYALNLVRHMDRAASAPKLVDALRC